MLQRDSSSVLEVECLSSSRPFVASTSRVKSRPKMVLQKIPN